MENSYQVKYMFISYYTNEILFKVFYIIFTFIIWSFMFYEYIEEIHRLFTMNIVAFNYMNFFGFISTNLNEYHWLNLYVICMLNLFMMYPYFLIYIQMIIKSLFINKSVFNYSLFYMILCYIFSIAWGFMYILPLGWDLYYNDLSFINIYFNIWNFYDFIIQGLYFIIILFQFPFLFYIICFTDYDYILFYYKYKYILSVDIALYLYLFFFLDFFLFFLTFIIWILLFDMLLLKLFYDDYEIIFL